MKKLGQLLGPWILGPALGILTYVWIHQDDPDPSLGEMARHIATCRVCSVPERAGNRCEELRKILVRDRIKNHLSVKGLVPEGEGE